MSPAMQPDDPGAEQPFVSHLIELRDRLIRMSIAILVVFLGLFPFANEIYVYVAAPLMAQLPEGNTMIATQVASPFLTPFKLALIAAVFLSMPFLLYQLWAFVAPGLYKHEKRLATPLLISSIFLFYLGVAFAYFVVFPLIFAFLSASTPDGVAMMTDITAYLDFVLALFFAFGIAFEIPIATILLVATGITTPAALVGKRPYVIRRGLRRRHALDPAGRHLPDALGGAHVVVVRAGDPLLQASGPSARERRGRFPGSGRHRLRAFDRPFQSRGSRRSAIGRRRICICSEGTRRHVRGRPRPGSALR
jgi:Tat protein translocase TatC